LRYERPGRSACQSQHKQREVKRRADSTRTSALQQPLPTPPAGDPASQPNSPTGLNQGFVHPARSPDTSPAESGPTAPSSRSYGDLIAVLYGSAILTVSRNNTLYLYGVGRTENYIIYAPVLPNV
jgi:hypothetical protein